MALTEMKNVPAKTMPPMGEEKNRYSNFFFSLILLYGVLQIVKGFLW